MSAFFGKFNPAYFRVDKNGSDQTGIADSTWTKVTWGNEVYDNGAYFASDKWTPRSGTHFLHSATYTSGSNMALNGINGIAIYKNGSLYLEALYVDYVASGALPMQISGLVEANGTDYFELYIYYDTNPATTGTLSGNAAFTYFEGFQVK